MSIENLPGGGGGVIVMLSAPQSFMKYELRSQFSNLNNLELIRGNHIRERRQLYSEQQIPLSKQPVHLKMAG
jgi:hypothetical protein